MVNELCRRSTLSHKAPTPPNVMGVMEYCRSGCCTHQLPVAGNRHQTAFAFLRPFSGARTASSGESATNIWIVPSPLIAVPIVPWRQRTSGEERISLQGSLYTWFHCHGVLRSNFIKMDSDVLNSIHPIFNTKITFPRFHPQRRHCRPAIYLARSPWPI